MPLFPLEKLELPLDAVGTLARDLLPAEDVDTFGLASNEKSNNVMYKVRTRQGGVYGLKFFRRDTVAIEEVARARVAPFVNSAPFLAHGHRAEIGPHPYAIFRWVPGELIHEAVGKLVSDAEAETLARQIADVLAGFSRTSIAEFPMPERFAMSNLVPFLREHFGPHLERGELDRMVDFCAAQRGDLERYCRGVLCLVHGALQENVVIERSAGEVRVTGVIDWEHAWQGEPVLDYLYLAEGLGPYPLKARFRERLHHHCAEVGLHFPRETERLFMLLRAFNLADKIRRAGFVSRYVRLHTEILLEEMTGSP